MMHGVCKNIGKHYYVPASSKNKGSAGAGGERTKSNNHILFHDRAKFPLTYYST